MFSLFLMLFPTKKKMFCTKKFFSVSQSLLIVDSNAKEGPKE